MKKIILLLFLLPIQLLAQIPLNYEQNRSLTYFEIVDAYKLLASKYPARCQFEVAGKGDNGREIHTFTINPEKATGSIATILINNGIHAGEPDGIDASIEFAEQILSGKLHYPNTRIVIIPVYNVDGNSLQSCCTRANQNGPLNQGFRGNARNLDLNRDFIKADAENTKTFYNIFHRFNPHVFIDNHVSNGADYQYTMTLITSQVNKLGKVLGTFVKNEFEPALFSDMATKGFPMAPYVNTVAETPDSGLVGFLETPRFATGYAALFNCIGFVPETHMLKPFKNRVIATRELMKSMVSYVDDNAVRFVQLKKKANDENLEKAKIQIVKGEKQIPLFPISWTQDKKPSGTILFKGYEANHKPSDISGIPRLYYDRNKPYTKRIPFYNQFYVEDFEQAPKAYIIPQAWHEVIDRLKLNNVMMKSLQEDTTVSVRGTYITSYKTKENPYEGHYLHYKTWCNEKQMTVQFFKGDFIIYTDQPAIRYLIETLSPKATDSFFNWNFFDSVLQQKEYFSDYVFEDTGAELLKNNPALRKMLEEKKAADPEFRKSGAKQLEFVYNNSPYHEKTVMLYPVFKLY